MPSAANVLAGSARWSVECADCLEWLRSLPDDSVDLLFTSPPYLEARTYGIGAGRKLDDWVAWMTEVVAAAAPKVKGLIAVNCEGQTRNYRYLPAPFLLVADLHRAGFNLRKPPVFHRVGIPGSGGPDWLRNDYEPVVCVTRSGKLPWSEPAACGKPPKYAPGGEMSYRSVDGKRRNVFGVSSTTTRRRTGSGNREVQNPASKLGRTKQSPGREGESEVYDPPAVANPGNVLKFAVGGNLMGHDLAHENEAPFPLELAAFFVKSFCPPGGVVADCFAGSGTTIDAAVQHGRRGIGCDVRQSQVDLTTRRLQTVTPALFA